MQHQKIGIARYDNAGAAANGKLQEFVIPRITARSNDGEDRHHIHRAEQQPKKRLPFFNRYIRT